MKQFLLITMFLIGFIGSAGSAIAGCAPGNWPAGDLCCVEVGDGSAISCTNGDCWICYGNCGGSASETVCFN